MEPSLSELKLSENCEKVLNTENGLTYWFQVLEEFLTADPLPEPTISVVEEASEEQEFVSHEIVAEAGAKDEEKGSADRVTPLHQPVSKVPVNSTTSIHNNKNLWKPLASKVEAQVSSPASQVVSRVKEEDDSSSSSISFNIKKRQKVKHRAGSKKCSQVKNNTTKKVKNVKNNDVMSIVLKNMVHNQKRIYSGMKMMVNPENGEYVLKSKCIKSAVEESFTIEPWMMDKPQVMQEPKEKLFLLNSKQKVNPVSNTCSPSSTQTFFNETNNEEESITVCPGKDILQTPTKYFIKERSDVSHVTTENRVSGNDQIVYWEEGNINKLTDCLSLSQRVKCLYESSEKSSGTIHLEIPEYLSNLQPYESPVPNKYGAAPGVTTFLSWEAVKERVEELQEETMTKFIHDYKTPTFKDDPQPFKRILFELDTLRKDVEVVIPNTGVPFIFIGICVYSCHLGKRKWKVKEFSQEDTPTKPLKTKKIGCPACLSIIKIARFPDFDTSGLSRDCEASVLKELKDAWDFQTNRVRFYIEYHLREPKGEDHKGHEVQYMVNSNRFKEPVDPRILDKIRALTRQGYTGTNMIQCKVDQFIREDLFQGEAYPPLDRRRYNPSRRDIRYAIFKAKEELKKEGKSVAQLQCSALATEIAEMAKEVRQEERLGQLRAVLALLWKSLKAGEPIQGHVLLGRSMDLPPSSTSPLTPTSASTPKRTYKKRKTVMTPPAAPPTPSSSSAIEIVTPYPSSSSGAADKDFLGHPHQLDAASGVPDQVMDQLYLTVPDSTETMFSAQLYAPEFIDLNPGLAETLQAPPPEDATVTEVYYYYPDGTCELATPVSLSNVHP